MSTRILLTAVFVLSLFAPLAGAEEKNATVWLGFPILGRDKQPAEINLTKDESLGSAFLLQLRRQALLIAARDELGAATRDEFLDEIAPVDAVKINDIDKFPGADVPYTDHQQFLAEVEKCSRNEFVTELQKLGVKKTEQVKAANANLDEERTKIENLLCDWALIPQFDAVRRTHKLIRETGETPELLTLLVKEYTQLQMLTNFAPRDSHRVFQARAMLYAQRAVAKYGDKYLQFRAAAWSLNNFHRLARLEFAEISEQKPNAWIDAAKSYADFDFKGLEKQIETADPKTERLLGKFLYFNLLGIAGEDRTLARPYGENTIADLPNCTRFYQAVFHINNFDMVYAPDGSLFYEHLARQIAPAIRNMQDVPQTVKDSAQKLGDTVKKQSGGLLGLFGGHPAPQRFSLDSYFTALADLLKTLSEISSADDRDEPSLQILTLLIRDDELRTATDVVFGIKGHNGSPDSFLTAVLPVLGSHPAADFLGLSYRNRVMGAPFWYRLTTKIIPYNLFSQYCVGMKDPFFDTDFHGRIYSPYFITCLFADRENVRDMDKYYRSVKEKLRPGENYFLTDIFFKLSPNNPQTAAIQLAHLSTLKLEDAEALEKKFDTFPIVRNGLTIYYQRNNHDEKQLDSIKKNFDAQPSQKLANQLAGLYLNQGEPEKAVEILQQFVKSPQSEESLTRYRAFEYIGRILFQTGKIKQAEEYFKQAAQTYSRWGLTSLAHYKEFTGDFNAAEALQADAFESYPPSRAELFGCQYRINSRKVRETMDKILARYERYKTAAPLNSEDIMNNVIEDHDVLYPCYCLDVPFPKQFGNNDVWQEQLFRHGGGTAGFFAWFESMKKEDKEKSQKLLNYIRDLWFLEDETDPFTAVQRKLLPKVKERKGEVFPYNIVAALFEADQRSKTPGNLNQTEIDYLILSTYQNEVSAGRSYAVMYLIGRYLDFYGQKEKALDYYRRVLGFRTDFHIYFRNFAVKELRKAGMTNDDYVKYSLSDPKVPKLKVSYKDADVFCRQLFRDYSESPSAAVLAKPVAEKPIAATNFGASSPLVPGWYQVTKILFHGNAVTENETVVYWRIPKEGDKDDPYWYDTGIAHVGNYYTDLQPRRDDGLYPVRLSVNNNTRLSALASFHNGKMALAVSLNPDEEPASMTPEPASNCVRIEMKKVADIPIPEPLISDSDKQTHTQTAGMRQSALTEDDGKMPYWINYVRLTAIIAACAALGLALSISIIKKMKR